MVPPLLFLVVLQHKTPPAHEGAELANYESAKALIAGFQEDVAALEAKSVAEFAGKHWTNSYGNDMLMAAENLRANFITPFEVDLKQQQTNLEKAKAAMKSDAKSRREFALSTFKAVRAACLDDYRAVGRYAGIDYADYTTNYNQMQGWIAVQQTESHKKYEDLKAQWFKSIEPAQQLPQAQRDEFIAEQKKVMLSLEVAWCDTQAEQWTVMRDWLKGRRKSLIITLWQWEKVSEETYPEDRTEGFEHCIISSFETRANAAKSPLDPPTSLTFDYDTRGVGNYPTVGVDYKAPTALNTNWPDIAATRDPLYNPSSINWTLHQAFSTPAAEYKNIATTTTTIGHAYIKFEDRAKRRAAGLKAEVDALQATKYQLEKALVGDVEKAKAAQTQDAEFTQRSAEVDAKISTTQGILTKIEQSEGSQPPGVKAWLQAEDSVQKSIASLDQKIHAAPKNADVSALTASLKRAQSQLSTVETELANQFKGTTTGDLHAQYILSLRDLQKTSYDIADAESKLIGQEDAILADSTKHRAALEATDKQLIAVRQKQAGFDPQVKSILATANGTPVFQAENAVDFPKFVQINKELDSIEELINAITAEKESTFAVFVAAENESIASQKYLGDLLESLAWWRFWTALGFDAYDIVRATQKGGVVGAVAELGKKILEADHPWGLNLDIGPGRLMGKAPNGIAADSIEAQINRDYSYRDPDYSNDPKAKDGPKLHDYMTSAGIARVGLNRFLKDTIYKAPKDQFNYYLGQWISEEYEEPFRSAFDMSLPNPLKPSSFSVEGLRKAWKESGRMSKQYISLDKGFFAQFTSASALKSFGKGLGESAIKDSLKFAINGYFDHRERSAWVDFVSKDAYAMSLCSIYRAQAQIWEIAKEKEDSLLDEKIKMLTGLDENSPFKVLLNREFPYNANIKITLALIGANPSGDPLKVLLGGFRADQINETSYKGDATGANREKDSTIPVVIR